MFRKFQIASSSSLFLMLFTSAFSVAQSHFKADVDFGGGTVISTFLDVAFDKDHFTITSPANGDVRIMGGKAKLGRLTGKLPKNGTIIAINGTQKNDSLIGDTNIPMFGKLKFRGILKDETLSGELFNDKGSVGTISGQKSTEKKGDYAWLYPKLIQTVRENIYSPDALKSKKWKKFDKKLETLCKEAHDDIEIFFGFNMMAQQLPFSHLSFTITEIDENEDEEGKPAATKSVLFEEKNPATAYLQIKNFSTSADELSEILPGIVSNPAYKNLIIDLRDNGGGGITSAFALAKHIATDDLEVGYFPTNKLSYSGFDPTLFGRLQELQPKSTTEFGEELRSTPGVKLVFRKPETPVFTGNLYVLTNGNTGSTCEPIVHVLKTNRKATIIGQRTAGAMLAASPYPVSGKYLLMIPIADFYAHNGERLDRVGVKPDVEVKSDDALKKALELIAAKN